MPVRGTKATRSARCTGNATGRAPTPIGVADLALRGRPASSARSASLARRAPHERRVPPSVPRAHGRRHASCPYLCIRLAPRHPAPPRINRPHDHRPTSTRNPQPAIHNPQSAIHNPQSTIHIETDHSSLAVLETQPRTCSQRRQLDEPREQKPRRSVEKRRASYLCGNL